MKIAEESVGVDPEEHTCSMLDKNDSSLPWMSVNVTKNWVLNMVGVEIT